MEQLRELTGTTERGADLQGLERGAQALGFDTLAAEIPYDELIQGDLLPIVLHWNRDHFIVVTEASFSKVQIHDPAQGKRSMSRDDFEAHRYGPGRSRAGLIIRPPFEGDLQSANTEKASDRKQSNYSWPLPWQFVALSTFFAGALSFLLKMLYDVMQQSVDLQFREGIWQHIGSLLLASAGLVLAAYLLRKQAISYGSKRGQAEINYLTEHLKVKAADISRPINGELYLKLINDIDDLRVWRAYNMGSVVIGAVSILISIIFLVAVNWAWGLVLIAAQALMVLLGLYVYRSSRDSREAAREAQLKQREALYEFAKVLPDTHSLDGGKYLFERLQQKNERAELAFQSISSEFSAERQMVRVLMLISSISLLGFGLYQLGFGGLQVGELIFGLLLVGMTLIPFTSISMSIVKWQRLQPARLRVSELHEPGIVLTNPLPKRPERITLVWDSKTGKEQQVTFPSSCRIALAGSDKETRSAIIAGLLGRRNVRNARIYFDEDFEEQRTFADCGKLSVIDAHSIVASGSIASNIAMVDRPDHEAVAVAAELAGIPQDAPPRGLYSLVGFDGEGISKEMASRTLIARSVYAGIDALVLDGATDALNTYDEGLLMDNLLPWCKGRMLVINAERMNAVYGSDLVINIEETEIDSVGSHERLLTERGSYYYQLTASQTKLT